MFDAISDADAVSCHHFVGAKSFSRTGVHTNVVPPLQVYIGVHEVDLMVMQELQNTTLWHDNMTTKHL